MSKTFRREKPQKSKDDKSLGNHGAKKINHAHDRTEKKQELRKAKRNWQDDTDAD